MPLRRSRGVNPRFRRRILKRDRYTCQICGRTGREVHHRVPVAVDPGREYDASNCVLLCRACHIRIHRVPVSARVQEWRKFVQESI